MSHLLTYNFYDKNIKKVSNEIASENASRVVSCYVKYIYSDGTSAQTPLRSSTQYNGNYVAT